MDGLALMMLTLSILFTGGYTVYVFVQFRKDYKKWKAQRKIRKLEKRDRRDEQRVKNDELVKYFRELSKSEQFIPLKP
jgi:hypothetical protein